MSINLEIFKKHIVDAIKLEMNWGQSTWHQHRQEREVDTSTKDETDLYYADKDRDYRLLLLGRNYKKIQELKAVFHRINTGSFGVCQSCEESIGTERLMANIMAQNCIQCQDEIERVKAS